MKRKYKQKPTKPQWPINLFTCTLATVPTLATNQPVRHPIPVCWSDVVLSVAQVYRKKYFRNGIYESWLNFRFVAAGLAFIRFIYTIQMSNHGNTEEIHNFCIYLFIHLSSQHIGGDCAFLNWTAIRTSKIYVSIGECVTRHLQVVFSGDILLNEA